MLHKTPFFVKADKPGFRSAKGKEISFFASFCPFCGLAVEKKEEIKVG
jgi:hypothetical protein